MRKTRDFVGPHRITDGRNFRLKDHDPDDTGGIDDKEQAAAFLEQGTELLCELQERLSGLSPKRLALLVLDLQKRLDTLKKSPAEPVAIVGLGCRFPGGADSPAAFWQLLHNGVDAIREVAGPGRPA